MAHVLAVTSVSLWLMSGNKSYRNCHVLFFFVVELICREQVRVLVIPHTGNWGEAVVHVSFAGYGWMI